MILPTSLCAGQVANRIAACLTKTGMGQPNQLSRFVALTHTEGCWMAIYPATTAQINVTSRVIEEEAAPTFIKRTTAVSSSVGRSA